MQSLPRGQMGQMGQMLSGWRNFLSLQTLVAFGDRKLYFLTFSQDAMTIPFDGSEMDENIFAIFTRNKAKTLAGTEPFDASILFGAATA